MASLAPEGVEASARVIVVGEAEQAIPSARDELACKLLSKRRKVTLRRFLHAAKVC